MDDRLIVLPFFTSFVPLATLRGVPTCMCMYIYVHVDMMYSLSRELVHVDASLHLHARNCKSMSLSNKHAGHEMLNSKT